jgi:putative DNA primase/helicase
MDPADPQLAATLLRRWMIGAIGCAYNPEGMSMQGVLVLQGAQNAGKTTWFWQLVQKNKRLGKEGVSIDPADRDSVKGAISHWLVELGEIDATFKKADIESLKQFITKDTDELFLRYSRAISTFPRRTAFVGTVNPMHYLHDETGNRRYWTIQCGPGFNAFHGIDMQQAWAQAKTIWESGEQHNLTREEMSALNAANEKHNQPNPIEELIQTRFQWDAPRTVNMTSTEVLVAIGYDKPNIKQTKETGMILRKLTGAEPKKSNGKSVFVMPPYTRMARRHDDGDDRPF